MFLVDLRGLGILTFLPEMGDPLLSRLPCSSAKAQAEIPLIHDTGVPLSWYTAGHLVTNLT